ncbi:hypothetical protein [Niabella ginsengisoli]|uniref:Uncharacterized protein n=1 Tax=Niabella ginsengisoli TaxID=522298 RepID=A0ABS9SQR0_9BACT|nr:hypothetical protein [Niabella ginsengisoli]MCH5600699.1 hypothetical protein [Niabella ginsengisoli]
MMVNRFRWLYTTYRFGDLYDNPVRRKDLGANGALLNFYFKGYKDQMSSRLSWAILPSTKELELKISVQFAVINNRAYPLGHYPGRPVDENYDLVAWKK